MKKAAYTLILGISLLTLTACSSNTTKNDSSKSENTAKSIITKSKATLKDQLMASPKADMNQKIDPKIVPNFLGMTLDQAYTLKDGMKDATFIVSKSDTVYRSDLEEGTILAQSAKAGTPGGGKWVTLIVSTKDKSVATDIDKAKF